MRRAKKFWPLGLGLALGWVGGQGLLARPDGQTEEALVLEQVRSLGDLHTVRHTYRDVLSLESSRRVADWAAPMPGAQALVTGATRNRALVTFTADVEAGVDLTDVRIERTPGGLALVVPRAQVYEPRVRVWIESHRRGTFWRDENVAARAQARVAARVRSASLRAGILSQAEQEAERRLREVARVAVVRFGA